MSEHLIIPDVHCRPGISNDRLAWAGSLAADKKPDIIICLGDVFDMPSLSSYDRGRKSFEGRRFKLDIQAGREGLEMFNKPIEDNNRNLKRQKKATYNPRKIMLMGNHEQRLERCVNLHPELDGTLTNKDFGFEEYGWEVIDFLKPIEVDGIFYSHYFVSGVKGESISGPNIATSILSKNMCSSTCGHQHILDWSVRASPNNKKMQALCAGCYLDKDQHEDFAHATEFLWWRGLVMKHNVHNGEYDLETISIDRVKKLYG